MFMVELNHVSNMAVSVHYLGTICITWVFIFMLRTDFGHDTEMPIFCEQDFTFSVKYLNI